MIKNTLKIVGAIIYTIRPSATFGACLLVLAAYQPKSHEWNETIYLLICTFVGAAYCFLVNDIYDREKDLLNDKQRPIATGVVPFKVAVLVAVCFGLVFLAIAYSLSLTVFLLGILFIMITSVYSYLNIRSGFLANIIVAFIVAGTQWGVAFIQPDAILLYAAFFLFFFSIPREMVLDWLDMTGDQAYGKSSLAINATTYRFNWIMILLLIGASISLVSMIYYSTLKSIPIIFFLASMLTAWISFIRFFLKANRKNALFGVRFSHLTFAFFIVAMLTR